MHTHVQIQNVTHGGQQAKHESAVCPGSDASKPTARWAVSAGARAQSAWSREAVTPSHLALFRPTWNTTCGFGYPQDKKDTDKPEWVQWRATKMLRRIEHLQCKERLWGLTQRLSRRRKAVHRLCAEACGRRTWDKLQQQRLWPEIKKRFFPLRTVKHWNRDRETDESLSLEGLRPEWTKPWSELSVDPTLSSRLD